MTAIDYTATGVDIREEQASDRDAIWRVYRSAFETEAEANLVDRLRDEGAHCASFVACEGARIVGHALFSAARLDYASTTLAIGALGPIGVLPEFQRRGTGAAMILAGIERCWSLDLPAIIVLGHSDYYPRFGFRRADTWSIRCEFDVPPEVFMILWSATPAAGPAIARYHAAFAEV